MTLGRTPAQADLLRSTANFCEGRVAPDSIYGVLHRECFELFPDEMFADLFTDELGVAGAKDLKSVVRQQAASDRRPPLQGSLC